VDVDRQHLHCGGLRKVTVLFPPTISDRGLPFPSNFGNAFEGPPPSSAVTLFFFFATFDGAGRRRIEERIAPRADHRCRLRRPRLGPHEVDPKAFFLLMFASRAEKAQEPERPRGAPFLHEIAIQRRIA